MKKYLVFYGFAKLTKKAVRKKSIVIQYANCYNYNEKQKKYIEQKMHIVHQRFQTKEEQKDIVGQHRNWTKYEYFVDDKKWKGSIDLILQDNYIAEENHVSKKEREEIRQKLNKAYYEFYKVERKPEGQQAIIFSYE